MPRTGTGVESPAGIKENRAVDVDRYTPVV